MSQLESLLSKFATLEKLFPGPVKDSICLSGKNPCSFHIVFGGLVHGNETGSLPAFIQMIEDFQAEKISFPGKVTFFIGNKEAARRNVRFVEADLNRSFAISNPSLLEHLRAEELKIILKTADVFIDYHQTTLQTQYPFYTFGFHQKSYLWARILRGTPCFITRWPGVSFSTAGMCSDEYVRYVCHKPAMTLELGEQGFHNDAEKLCYTTMRRAIQAGKKLIKCSESLVSLAHRNADFHFYKTIYKELFYSREEHLLAGFTNFSYVSKGQLLGYRDSAQTQQLIAPHSGYLLFPKYPPRDEKNCVVGPLAAEIYHLAQQIDIREEKALKKYSICHTE